MAEDFDKEFDKDKINKRIKSLKSKDEIEAMLASVISKTPDEHPERVLTFTDLNKLFDHDGHILIEGQTGYGKTTLLLTLVKRFIQEGWKVLYRDDGGLEFGYLARYVSTQIFVPEGKDIQLNISGFNAKVVRTNDPKTIIEETYNNNYPFNVIVFDAYAIQAEDIAEFFSGVFGMLIHKCQQTPRSKKERLLFSIDELNDLVSPRGMGTTPTHSKLRGLFETNIRKLRKHKVRLLSSSHRFTQIPRSVRSQCDHIFIKKSYGADIWDFMSRALITANNKTFWKVLRNVVSMPRNKFLYFDPDRKFDFGTFLDIPRDPNVDVEALGIYENPDKKGKKVSVKRYERDIRLAWLLGKGIQHTKITPHLENMTVNHINRIACDLRAANLIDFAEV